MSSRRPPAPAGWYPDPRAAGGLRYFDGCRWTPYVARQLRDGPGSPGRPGGPEPARRAAAPYDLARNLAGQAARSHAAVLREAAPLRSWLGRTLRTATAEWSWEVDAAGQAQAGEALGRLAEGWHVLHAISLGGAGEIDHLVVGPAGVFSLQVVHHPRARVWADADGIWVNGEPSGYRRAALEAARQAARLLTGACGFAVGVRPVVVVVGAALRHGGPTDGLGVVSVHRVTGSLEGLPARLPTEVVKHIYDRARSSATWRPAGWLDVA